MGDVHPKTVGEGVGAGREWLSQLGAREDVDGTRDDLDAPVCAIRPPLHRDDVHLEREELARRLDRLRRHARIGGGAPLGGAALPMAHGEPHEALAHGDPSHLPRPELRAIAERELRGRALVSRDLARRDRVEARRVARHALSHLARSRSDAAHRATPQ
jgi:hypothetical protein